MTRDVRIDMVHTLALVEATTDTRVTSLYFIHSSVGAYFASASKDKTAKLWVTDRIYPIRSFIGHSYDVDVSRGDDTGCRNLCLL